MNDQKQTTSPSSQPPRAGSGFTMIELLVVMFVIAMLLVIGIPAALRFQNQAKLNACRVTVNIIDKALDMYHKQHKSYPSMLEMASKLIGQSFELKPPPGDPTAEPIATEVPDGHPGPGYRLEPRGTVYGPWNGVDKLARSGDYDVGIEADRIHFLDAFGNRIWYCPFGNPLPETYTDTGEFAFKKTDSEDGVTITSIADYATDEFGKFYRRDYIIMSPGANGKWGLIRGSDAESGSAGATVPTDDVTNFKKD